LQKVSLTAASDKSTALQLGRLAIC